MDFYVGQEVAIREWDDMESEFGISDHGSIDCAFCFTTTMKEMCGSIHTIKSLYQWEFEGKKCTKVEFLADKWEEVKHFMFSTDMIRPLDNKFTISTEDFEGMFEG